MQMREYARAITGDRPVPEYVFKILDLLEPVANEGEVFEAKISAFLSFQRQPATYDSLFRFVLPHFLRTGSRDITAQLHYSW